MCRNLFFGTKNNQQWSVVHLKSKATSMNESIELFTAKIIPKASFLIGYTFFHLVIKFLTHAIAFTRPSLSLCNIMSLKPKLLVSLAAIISFSGLTLVYNLFRGDLNSSIFGIKLPLLFPSPRNAYRVDTFVGASLFFIAFDPDGSGYLLHL